MANEENAEAQVKSKRPTGESQTIVNKDKKFMKFHWKSICSHRLSLQTTKTTCVAARSHSWNCSANFLYYW